jgi:hypothetical protein
MRRLPSPVRTSAMASFTRSGEPRRHLPLGLGPTLGNGGKVSSYAQRARARHGTQ